MRRPTSTTVVIVKLHVVCSANMARSLGANSARQTRRARAPHAAAWTAQDTRRDAVSRERSAAHQPARGLEGGQSAPPGALRDCFSRWCCGQVCGPQHGQERIRPHRQGAVPRPAGPMPDCILGRAVGALRRRRTTSHRRQWGCNGAAQGSPRPSSQRGPVGPSPACHRHPSSSSNLARSVVTCPWRAGPPDICLPRDGAARRLGPRFPPRPSLAILPVHPLPRHPGGRHGRVQRPLQPLPCPRRLGGTGALRRHAGALAPSHGVRPRWGEIQFAIPHDVPLSTRLGQKYPTVGMLHAPCRPALWPGDPSRMLALLEKPRLIKHEHGLRIAQRLDDVSA